MTPFHFYHIFLKWLTLKNVISAKNRKLLFTYLELLFTKNEQHHQIRHTRKTESIECFVFLVHHTLYVAFSPRINRAGRKTDRLSTWVRDACTHTRWHTSTHTHTRTRTRFAERVWASYHMCIRSIAQLLRMPQMLFAWWKRGSSEVSRRYPVFYDVSFTTRHSCVWNNVRPSSILEAECTSRKQSYVNHT